MPSIFTGNGLVSFQNGNQYPCTFTTNHPDSADTEVRISIVGNYVHVSADYGAFSDPALRTLHLSGQTADGYSLTTDVSVSSYGGNAAANSADIVGITSTHSLQSTSILPTATYKCYLTNLLFYGTHATTFANGSWTMDRLPLSLLARDCELRMLDERHTLRDSLQKTKIQITSCLSIPAQVGDSLQAITDILFDITSLISFAQGCFVSCVRIEEIDTAGAIKSIHLLTTKTRAFVAGLEVIPDNTPPNPFLRTFLELGLPHYMRYKFDLKLPVFLTYYLESKLHNTKSIKFLLACIAAESIKFNFATWQQLPKVPTGLFARARIWVLSTLLNQSPMSFRTLLAQTFTHFGLAGEKFSFIKFRNNVVHNGDEHLSFPDWRREHFKLVNQLDRLFLKICGYSGSYLDVSDNFTIKIL